MSDKAAIIKEAQKYLARGQVDKAIAEWEKLIKESPDGNTYNTVGDLYLKKGDKTLAVDSYNKAARFFRDEGFSLKALALYKKVLNIEAANAEALFALGELSEEKGIPTDAIKYYLASADILSKAGKKDALLKTYDKILNLSPGNIPLRNKVAELFIKEGLKPEAAREYAHIARLYDDKEDANNAQIYFKKALELQPNSKDALLGLSSILEKKGDQKQSLEYIKRAIALSPDDAEITLKCAQFLIKQESFEEAMQYVSKIIALEPSNIIARKLRGEIYLNEGDKQKAWEEYNAVIDEMVFEEKIDEAIETLVLFKDVEPVETRKKLISLYRQKGDAEAAFGDLVFLGDTFVLSDGMLKEALSCYQEALQIHPDDADLPGKITDIKREFGEEQAAAPAEKSVEESLAEADIFFRYGLYDEAKKLLENLKIREPLNTDVHVKLKSLYLDTGDKEQAVTECLILAQLYNKSKNIEQRGLILKEAYEINPQDPRLIEKTTMQPLSHEAVETVPSIEDYTEDIAEAEFYMRQGLYDDAKAIYQRLLNLFPGNEEIKQKLSSIEIQPEEASFKEEISAPFEKPFETIELETPAEGLVTSEVFEAQEAPEPTLGNEVLDIFEEFKKGIEKELGAEDFETHYNLGIAYKEMGLIDDAIKEFQTAKNDPKKLIQSVSMLGICYMSKGLYSLAIESFGTAMEKLKVKDESYWGVKYDLAEAYEKNGDISEALRNYTEVYGWNSKFRNVAEKINQLRVTVAKPAEKPVISEKPALPEKQKIKKERVSYL